MCSKTTRSTLRNRSKRRKPPRKTRTKPKTRSLQKDFDFSPALANTTTDSPQSEAQTDYTNDHHRFVHLLEEKEDNNVAYLLDDADTSATLNGLIWSGSGGGGVVSSEEDSLCPSLTYATTTTTGTTSSLLERSALRGAGKNERDLSEERWVCYEEVTSCVPEYGSGPKANNGLVLSLKLDYDEIMNAWSDKGPLFVDHGVRGVPDVLNDEDGMQMQQDVKNAFFGFGDVPHLRLPGDANGVMDGEKSRKLGPREAGVLRYKKKRQNRLFSKRIRYEVRKLNAEKRPRMKGRFVKRS